MDNMGGLLKLYYIDAEDFVSLEAAGNSKFTLSLDNEAVVNEIEFTQDTGRISEMEDQTDNGLIYNFEVQCKVPKIEPDNANQLGDLRQKRLLILAEDNNNNLWLAGSPGTYFNITCANDAGTNSQDFNNRTLKITAALTSGCVFINTLS